MILTHNLQRMIDVMRYRASIGNSTAINARIVHHRLQKSRSQMNNEQWKETYFR